MSKNDKSAIIKLVLKYKDDDIVLDYLKLTLDSFGEYIDIINKQENLAIISKYQLSAEDYKAQIVTLDRHRRMCHNTIISGIKRINLLCKENDMPLFFDGDEEDRVEIANFVLAVVTETFKNNIGH